MFLSFSFFNSTIDVLVTFIGNDSLSYNYFANETQFRILSVLHSEGLQITINIQRFGKISGKNCMLTSVIVNNRWMSKHHQCLYK